MRELLGRGRYVTALRLAREGAESSDGAERVDMLLLAARAAQMLGLYDETVELAVSALAVDGIESDRRARVLGAAGAAMFHKGDHVQAEDYLLQAAAIPATPLTTADTGYNLGKVYEAMRCYDMAVHVMRQAADLYASLDMPADELRARQNAAWVLLHMPDLPGARAEMFRCAELVRPNTPEQAQHLAMEALAMRLDGQCAEAARLCEDLLTPGHPGATTWCRCFALWLAADVAAEEGQPALARQFLAQARQQTYGAQDPSLWNRITALQNKLDGL